MSTKRELVLEAVKTVLKTMTSVSAAKVERSRIFPEDESDCPCVGIEPLEDAENEIALSQFNHTLLIDVIVTCAGTVPDSNADPIVKEVRQKLMADRSLGGLLMNLTPKGVKYEFDPSGQALVSVFCHFELFYRENS